MHDTAQAFDPHEGEVRLYIVQVQQLEWPEDEEDELGKGEKQEAQEQEGEAEEEESASGSASRSGGAGMAAGRAPRRRRHGVVHRVEPVPPSRYV